MDQHSEDSTNLGLTILSNGRLPPQKWNLRTSPTFKSMIPSTPASIRQLKYVDRSFLTLQVPKIDMEILRKRILRYSTSKAHYVRYGLTRSALNKIIKQAKNLKSLTLKGDCGVSNFKGIRKAKNLQDLSVRVTTKIILMYPQLFKHLTSLKKVKLYITWFRKNSKNKILKKFFESVINLPKLQHLTIWLDEGFGSYKWLGGDFFYYKTLLAALHKAKVPSFEIVVGSHSTPPNLSTSSVDWGNFIDTLYIGTIGWLKYQDRGKDGWPLATKPEKRLRLSSPLSNSKVDKLVNESVTIKNLTVKHLFGKDQNYYIKDAKSCLTFISQVKTLENLTLFLDADFENNDVFVSALNQELAKIESLESVRAFALDFSSQFQRIPTISPPYGRKMRNLRTLSLRIWGEHFDLLSWAEALKDLVSLENFNFEYIESVPYSTRENLDCNFPFEQLEKLKSISLKCNLPFSKNSREQLLKSIKEIESMESLKIEGEILGGMTKKKAYEFTAELCLKKSLELVSFHWKSERSSRWTEVHIERVNGKMVVTSKRQQ